jgi:hypothetical protein
MAAVIAYVNATGFDLMAGEKFAPGAVALVTADGLARQVADGLAFPNGMAATPANSTLIVAESYANKLTRFDIAADGSLSTRRVWADLRDGVPDGICLDAEDAVWYADVPNKRCVRVREGGDVLQTVDMDLGCFACMLGAWTDERCSWWSGSGRPEERRRPRAIGPGGNPESTRTTCWLAIGRRDGKGSTFAGRHDFAAYERTGSRPKPPSATADVRPASGTEDAHAHRRAEPHGGVKGALSSPRGRTRHRCGR